VSAPPTCRTCGAALPRTALFCPRCAAPVFLLTGRRARSARNASMFGMAGAILMVLQGLLFLVGGVIALFALRMAADGDLTGASDAATRAAIPIGVTLLFDLVGVAFLAGAFWMHSRTARAGATIAAKDPERQALARVGLLATLSLLLWLALTLMWRVTLAGLFPFYPSLFGVDTDLVTQEQIRRAASIMLGLWAAAALALFAGAVFGTRFLQRARGMPVTFWRLVWPIETALHFAAALVILAVAPGILARFQIEFSTLQLIETLGLLELVVVPALGMFAYTYLFLEFLRLFRQRTAVGPAAPAPAAPPGGEA